MKLKAYIGNFTSGGPSGDRMERERKVVTATVATIRHATSW